MQDLLEKNGEEICDVLIQCGGHFYVCGDVSMASDVTRALSKLLMTYRAYSEAEADQLIESMKVMKYS